MLEKIVSGGQSGADIAGLIAAKEKGITTGGTMPKGWRTLDGPKPEYADLYGVTEHASSSYVPRTFQNVKESDATIRIAGDLNSSGEKCTLKAILQYKKPYFDVHVIDTGAVDMHPKTVAQWIIDNNIKVLNVAGNSEKTCAGIEAFSKRYIVALINEVKLLESSRGESTSQ